MHWYFRPYRGKELDYHHLEQIIFSVTVGTFELYLTPRCVGIEWGPIDFDDDDEVNDVYDFPVWTEDS